MECVLQILRCAQNDKMTICHPERSEGSAASYKADSCRAAAGREEKGEYKKGGADPIVSDVAPPPRSGGNLLSHPSGQYHRRWRA